MKRLRQIDLRLIEEGYNEQKLSGGQPDVILDPIVEPIVPYSVMETGNWGYDYLRIAEAENHYNRLKRKVCWGIVDTAGVFTHAALQEASINEYGFDATGEGKTDGHGHGHHVGGIIAAVHPLQPQEIHLGIGPRGFTFIIPAKGLNGAGQGYDEWLAAAVEHLVNVYLDEIKPKGWAFGINGSFGGGGTIPKLNAALQGAAAEGIFLNFAAGNSGCACQDKVDCSTVGFPARDHGNAIAAIMPNGAPASFSSCGPSVDFAAPGYQIYSTYKDGRYVVASGTSMASPMDAGLNSWLLALYPEIETQEQLNEYKRKWVRDIFNEGFDIRTGWGVSIITPYLSNEPEKQEPPEEDPPKEPGQPDGLQWWGWLILAVALAAILFFIIQAVK